MTKPRWIDAGAFRTLRTATRNHKLAVIVGPRHGDAKISSRAQLKAALGDADRSTLAGDERFKSQRDAGLTALYALKLPGIVTTSVSDAALASAPAGSDKPRVFGPETKGLNSAWERKEPFVVRLGGAADEPASLVLTNKDRKALVVPDSRYQNFLRATFGRTVLFSGFDLGDSDFIELLEDVSRGFNGHVPPNMALVPAGSTDPSTALRASMHFGTSLVEYPPELTAEAALAEVATLLEELEVPKPASGNPPRGFTELTADYRKAVPVADAAGLDLFDRGDSSSWQSIKAKADAPRTVSAQIQDFLVGEVEPGQTRIALVRARKGEGKSTLLRRIAWDLSEAGCRVFWREFGAGVPDRYIPEEDEKAIAIFFADDADQLDNLPSLVNYLAAHGGGKARFLLAAENDEWDRSGLDHRIRRTTTILDVSLACPEAGEARAIAEGLRARGHLAPGLTPEAAGETMVTGDRCLMDRIAEARGVGSVAAAVGARIAALDAKPDAALLRRAYLATALVHRFGMSLGRGHLAAVLGVPEPELDARVLAPLDKSLVPAGPGSVRTRHPVVAAAACGVLSPTDEERDEMVLMLLTTLPGGSVSDETVFHLPSELIRALRHGPLAPLMLDKFFEAGANAADNDVLFWFDRGRFDVGFSRWEPALAAFDKAMWKQPGDTLEREHNAAVQGYRARCLLSLHRKKEAAAAVYEGLQLSPRDGVLQRLEEKLAPRRRPGFDARGPRGPRQDGGGGPGGPGGGGEGEARRGPPREGRPPRGEPGAARRGPPTGATQPRS
ncbi:MAG TPA: SIR2 family protein [Planctomycetota bacterium]|nr:SIR2 family protein [Planctomycetota bacterium]